MRGNLAIPLLVPAILGSIPACAGEPAPPVFFDADLRVYPRVCGGTPCVGGIHRSGGGLSPRVRGNLLHAFYVGGPGRSIPACAGEPAGCAAPPDSAWVYPRVCGGTHHFGRSTTPTKGLSPRVRGNPFDGIGITGQEWSIPACAGEPSRPPASPVPARVYPRVCGGTPTRLPTPATVPGLSPRVRGNRPHGQKGLLPDRSIPACAGEPGQRAGGVKVARVYPRVCGGTRITIGGKMSSGGLSPRVRGNHIPLVDAKAIIRSIPACAGEPRSSGGPGGACMVYPRVCGGTFTASTSRASFTGLSPRVRGNLQESIHDQTSSGSIPACAGEPVFRVRAHQSLKVYPRVCGGTQQLASWDTRKEGLSPRVRGNPDAVLEGQVRKGSIPACAGEPRQVSEVQILLPVYPRVCGGTASAATRDPSI